MEGISYLKVYIQSMELSRFVGPSVRRSVGENDAVRQHT